MNYESFIYLFPNVAKRTIPPNSLEDYDDGKYLATVNHHGKPIVVFTDGVDLFIYNHRKRIFRNVDNVIPFRKLTRPGKWAVYSGVYISKRYTQEDGEPAIRGRFIITDVLVWGNELLTGSTFTERLDLLNSIFVEKVIPLSNISFDYPSYTIPTHLPGIVRSNIYDGGFDKLLKRGGKKMSFNGIILHNPNEAMADLTKRKTTTQQLLCIKKRFIIF